MQNANSDLVGRAYIIVKRLKKNAHNSKEEGEIESLAKLLRILARQSSKKPHDESIISIKFLMEIALWIAKLFKEMT